MDQLILPDAVSNTIVDVELTENNGVIGLETTTKSSSLHHSSTSTSNPTTLHGVAKSVVAASLVANPHHSTNHHHSNHHSSTGGDVDFDSDSTNPLPPAMKKLKLKDDDTSSFAFQNPTKQCLSRIHNDLTKLYKDPVDGIFVVPDDKRANLCHAIVLGPQDTPYEFGFFYFIMEFPNQYPHEPPRVTLQTTGGGTVRFNPNLYRCGKVCLSILGTWNGPSWTPALTIGSVLLSIQSLMNATPYHNEPGFETINKGGRPPQQYNYIIRHETIRVAVIGMVDLATKTIQKQQQLEAEQQQQLGDQQIIHSGPLRHQHQHRGGTTGTVPLFVGGITGPGRGTVLPEKFAQLVLETFFGATAECCQYICEEYKTLLDGKPFEDPYKRNKGTFRFGKLQRRIKELLLLEQQQQQQQQVVMEEG